MFCSGVFLRLFKKGNSCFLFSILQFSILRMDAVFQHSDIVFRIISRLNLIDVFAFVVVCRRWNALLRASFVNAECHAAFWSRLAKLRTRVPQRWALAELKGSECNDNDDDDPFISYKAMMRDAAQLFLIPNAELEYDDALERKMLSYMWRHYGHWTYVICVMFPRELFPFREVIHHSTSRTFKCAACTDRDLVSCRIGRPQNAEGIRYEWYFSICQKIQIIIFSEAEWLYGEFSRSCGEYRMQLRDFSNELLWMDLGHVPRPVFSIPPLPDAISQLDEAVTMQEITDQ